MKHALLVATVVIMVSGAASAEIPQVLGYQGRITDNSGVPVADGTYAMRFRIYDDETAGALLWDSNDDSVVVAGGAFSVMLGESPQPTLSLAFDEDYWLLVTFDGEDQLPRKRLGSVGYAYMASGIVPGTEMVDSRGNPIFKGTNLGTGAGLRGDSEQGDGVRGESSATDGKGVYGISTATTGQTYGGSFESSSSTYGRGVFAWAKGTTGQAVGVYGVSSSPSGYAVLGEADATTGTNYGVYGKTNSSSGYGVFGEVAATIGTNYGVCGKVSSTSGSGVFGRSTATTGTVYGGRFESSSSAYGRGVFGWAKATSGQTMGVYGLSSSPSGYGIFGEADATTGTNYAVYGETDSPDGYGGYFDGRGYFSGNVGVGTTSPGAKLDVRGSAVFNEDGADSDFRVEGYTNENLIFVDADSNRVGIGTGAPNAMLDVRGSAVFNEDSTDSDFRIAGVSRPNLFFVDASEGKIGIGTNSPSVRLDVDGTAVFSKVGIGITSPDYNLDVNGRINASGMIRASDSTGARRAYIDGDEAEMATVGPNGQTNFGVTHTEGHPNYGLFAVADDEANGLAGMKINDSGVGTMWAGLKSFRMENPNQPGTEIWYVCIEGPEAAAYIRGTARLDNGRASISFPDHFQAVATEQGMTVQLTPRSAESEGLAVTEQSVEGIEVRELRNGTGSYEFHYTVMAVRKGFEDYQVIQPAMDLKLPMAPPAPGT